MKKQLFTLLGLILLSITASAQTLWEEDFESYAEDTGVFGIGGTPSGDYPDNVTKWRIDAWDANFNNSINDYARVYDNGSGAYKFKFRDTDGEIDLIFQEVVISSETGDVIIRIDDLDFNMTTDTNVWHQQGYLDIDYSLDGGSNYIEIANYNSEGNTDHTFFREVTDGVAGDRDLEDIEIVIPNATIGSATSIKIRISVDSNAGGLDSNTAIGGGQEIEIDDVEIKRGGSTLFLEDFQSYADKTGIVGTGSHLSEEKGDYSSVTKWSLTLGNTEQLRNRYDYAKVTKNNATNGTKALLFNDVGGNRAGNIIFETETIDISDLPEITFGMGLNFTSTTYESSDYFDIYYSLDNGTNYILVQDNGTGHTFSGTNNIAAGYVNFSETLNNLNATQFKLKIEAKHNNNNEDFQLDNIKVKEFKTVGFVPGEINYDPSGYVQYRAGNIPIVISVPHGGILKPSFINDRDCSGCIYGLDGSTQTVSRGVYNEFFKQTGFYPHMITNLLSRSKFDANRDIGDAADGIPIIEEIWRKYHNFIDIAKAKIVDDHSRGLFIDLHSHGHAVQRIELGYTLSKSELQLSDSDLNVIALIEESSIRRLAGDNISNLTHAELLRGQNSLGTLLHNRGFPAVPSSSDPYPQGNEAYFNGGYNTQRHGSRDTNDKIDGIQIELNSDARRTESSRELLIDSLTKSLMEYINVHYISNFFENILNLTSDNASNYLETNFKIYPNPSVNYFDLISNIDEIEIVIYNFLGQKVLTKTYLGNKIKIDFLPKGYYSVQFKKGKMIMGTSKLIKN